MKMCHCVLERSYNLWKHTLSHAKQLAYKNTHNIFSLTHSFTPLFLSLFCTSSHHPSSLSPSLHIIILSSPVMPCVSNHLVCLQLLCGHSICMVTYNVELWCVSITSSRNFMCVFVCVCVCVCVFVCVCVYIFISAYMV